MGDLNEILNYLAGTIGWDAQKAANVYAGTSGLDLLGALNAKAGTTGLGFNAVCNSIAGTTGYDGLGALKQLDVRTAVSKPTRPTLTIVSVTAAGSQNLLSWTSVSGAFYRVYRGPDASHLDILATVAGGTTTYTDSTAVNGTAYVYKVSANVGDYETPSTTVSATPSAFVASSVAGQVGWWDPSVASSITSATGRLTALADLSGSGFTQTGAGTARPTTGAHTQGGLNVIEFDGVANLLRNAAISVPAGNALTVFAVLVPSATTSFERMVSFDAGANDYDNTSSIAAILRDSTNLGVASYYNNSERGTKAMTNAAHVVTSQRNGDSHLMRVDGVAGSTVTGLGTANFGFTRLALGGDTTGAFYTGYMGSVLWYNAALSAANLTLVESYLKNMWATP